MLIREKGLEQLLPEKNKNVQTVYVFIIEPVGSVSFINLLSDI